MPRDPRTKADPHRVPFFTRLAGLFRRQSHPIPADLDDPIDFMGDVAEWWERQFRLAGDRRERYRIFDEMDTFGLVMGVLDVYAEETTQPDYDKQRTVWIESKSSTMIQAGDECLRNCAAEDRITPIVRRLAKYGDAFQRLLYATGKGVLGWRYVSAAKIHRLEDKYGRLIGFREDGKKYRGKKRPVSWPWDYIHFRLLGRDEEQGYGTSLLEPMFRPWRQLCVRRGTLIHTTEGPIKIEDLEPGTEVYCHDPATEVTRETPVVAVLKMGEQKLLRIRTAHRQIVVTENHGMLVQDAKGDFGYKKAKDLIASGGVGRENWHGYQNADRLVLPALRFGAETHTVQLKSDHYYVQLEGAALYDAVGVMDRIRACGLATSAKNAHAFLQGARPIQHADYLRLCHAFDLPPAYVFFRKSRQPVPFGTDLTFTADAKFARLFGFMLGDGWITRGTLVGFALGVDDAQNERYSDLFREVFRCEAPSLVEAIPGKTGGQALFYSAAIADILRTAGFLTGFAEKRVPAWVWGMSPTFKRELLYGLLDADGGWQEGSNGWRLSLANRPLIEAVVTLCQQTGFKVSREIAEIRREGKQPAYRIWISANPHDKPVEYERVTHVDSAGYGSTYDLTVADDLHNFVADGVVSHNTLAEDSVLMYRLRRSPDRNLIEIDVGDMEEHEAMQFVNAWRKRFRKNEFVDPASANYKKQYNPLTPTEDIWLPKRPDQTTNVSQLSGGGDPGTVYDLEHFRRKFFGTAKVPQAYFGFEGDINCFKLATRIPCLDGKTRTLRQIIDRYEATGELPWVYAYDAKTQQVVPGEVTWAGVTRPKAEVVEVELDDGTKHVCTPEHRWYTLDGQWVEAQHLAPGVQLLPLRRSIRPGSASYSGYEVVHDPFGGAQLTHLRVADTVYLGARDACEVPNVHHRDRRKRNNTPANLQVLEAWDHVAEHGRDRHRALTKYRKEHGSWNKGITKASGDPRASRLRRTTYVDKHCLTCREPFRVPLVRKRKAFCSPACAGEWGARARVESGRALTRCQHCDVQFETVRSRLDAGKDQYCSRTCYRLDRRAARLRTCMYCGMEFDAPKPTSRFCGKPCATAFKNKEAAGRIPVPNHRVLAVRRLTRRYDTGDITVRTHHNFFVADQSRGGVLVHNSKATLMQQDVRFARSAKRLRKGAIYGLRQLLDMHYTLLPRDPEDTSFDFTQTGNEYIVQMSPIAYLDEFERLELIQLRYNIVESMGRLAQDMNLDAKVWATYILLHYAKLPEDMVLKLIAKTPPGPPAAMGGEGGGVESVRGDYEDVMRRLPPEAQQLLVEIEDEDVRQRVVEEVIAQRVWAPMDASGYYNIGAREQIEIAHAVHNSAALRRSIFNFHVLGLEDLQTEAIASGRLAELMEHQTDRSLMPVVSRGVEIEDDFQDDRHAQELHEDLANAGISLQEHAAEARSQALED